MTVNQSIKPITLIRNKGLKLGECDLENLAKEYGTPLYVIDETTLRQTCREYKKAFENQHNINLMYASKALCNLAISRIIDEEGFGFDVVSSGEIYTVYKAGVDMSKVLFNGNNKTTKEIEIAMDLGVRRFSIDNFNEIELLQQITKEKNITINVLLRITPGIECHTHDYIKTGQIDSKFGFDMNQIDSAISLLKASGTNLILKGLHAHIGSQIFELVSYRDEIVVLIEELERINKKHNIKLTELNIGGGLGVKYVETDRPPSIYDYANTINEALNNYSKELTIYLEPGRSIISTSGVTLYTIGSSKLTAEGKKYVAIDGGMSDNPRPSMYGAEYTVEKVQDYDEDFEQVTIAGRFCESGDILVENVNLPKLRNGDILCVYNTGAYNYSMSSNYNRVEKPAMVLVNSSQSDIIVSRESLDDLIARENIPDRLRKL